MNMREFRRRCAATGIRVTSQTGEACRLVLVRGKRGREACEASGLGVENEAALSRALAKLREVTPADACPHCGRTL